MKVDNLSAKLTEDTKVHMHCTCLSHLASEQSTTTELKCHQFLFQQSNKSCSQVNNYLSQRTNINKLEMNTTC